MHEVTLIYLFLILPAIIFITLMRNRRKSKTKKVVNILNDPKYHLLLEQCKRLVNLNRDYFIYLTELKKTNAY